MPKEIPKTEQPKKQESLDKTRDKQAQEEKEPVFATEEEIAEKEDLVKQLKEAEKDKSVQGLEKQREIKLALLELDQRREQRIAKEKGEEIYDEEKGIFENIRFKETADKKTGETSYISRHRGRQMVILRKSPTEEVEPNKPYKAQVIKRDGRFIYVKIVE